MDRSANGSGNMSTIGSRSVQSVHGRAIGGILGSLLLAAFGARIHTHRLIVGGALAFGLLGPADLERMAGHDLAQYDQALVGLTGVKQRLLNQVVWNGTDAVHDWTVLFPVILGAVIALLA